MTREELETLMNDTYENEFLKYDKIEKTASNRPDLHAFILLDKLVPDTFDMVSGAEHDEIYLSVDVDNLAEVITEEQVLELVRCGVRYSDDCLCMFV